MSQPASGPEDDGYIGYMLSDVARLIRTVFDRRVRDMGLTRAQWLVLTRVYRRPGVSQTELADMLEIDRASAGRMIDRMEKNGWVERRAGQRRPAHQPPASDGGCAQGARRHVGDRRSDGRRCAVALSADERAQYAELHGQGEGPAAGAGRSRAMSARTGRAAAACCWSPSRWWRSRAALFWWLSGGRYVSTDNAYVKAHIVQIAPEVSGQVRRVLVRDHAGVERRREPDDHRIAALPAGARQRRGRARRRAHPGRDPARHLARGGEPSWPTPRRAPTYFQRQWQRQEELAIKGVASVAKREESQNDARAAADRVASVREKLQRVLTALNGDPQLPADEHPMVRDKTAARERAALDLARTTIRAPVDGVVVNMRVQQGEQVKAATPLFVLVVVSRPWVEANFKETELTHVRVGQKATVVLDTYPDTTWEAVVESLSPATGAEFAVLPPQNAVGQLGQGRAAPAGEAAAAAAGRRAAVARRHDRDGEDRHRPRAHGVGDVGQMLGGRSAEAAETVEK